MNQSAQPWHVLVRFEDVPETVLHLDLVADAQVRAGLASLSGVTDIPRLEAALDIVRHGNGLRVTGRVSATVGQTCVVTLEPLQNELDEPLDVVFAPATSDFTAAQLEAEDLAEDALREPPEIMSDGTADVGAIAAEFLLLGIDPYPRKPGVEFKSPAEQDAVVSPFASLAKLKDSKN
jgi:uncharacterized metal-binding protein YceD (DUF177 family)